MVKTKVVNVKLSPTYLQWKRNIVNLIKLIVWLSFFVFMLS